MIITKTYFQIIYSEDLSRYRWEIDCGEVFDDFDVAVKYCLEQLCTQEYYKKEFDYDVSKNPKWVLQGHKIFLEQDFNSIELPRCITGPYFYIKAYNIKIYKE